MIGKIKFFNQFQGYGYILSPDGQEIYFHATSCSEESESLQFVTGQLVYFDLIQTHIGFEALNLRTM